MTSESPNVVRTPSWRDEHLERTCGFANGRGGVLESLRVAHQTLPRNPLLAEAMYLEALHREDGHRNRRHDPALRRGGPAGAGVRGRLGVRDPDLEERPYTEEGRGTTQEEHGTTPITTGTTGKTAGKTTAKRILAALRRDPEISLAAVAKEVDLTVDGVRYHIDELKSAGAVRRVGSSRSGRWEVLK